MSEPSRSRVPKPGEGRTYSLFGDDQETDGYYRRIRLIADDLVQQGNDLKPLLEIVRRTSRSKRHLRRLLLRVSDVSLEAALARTLREQLHRYTVNVESHLNSLPLAQHWDRVLATSEEQYHFHMLEVELVNRLNLTRFRDCDMRLAFLPHCLHDVTVTCQSVVHGEDHVCRSCTVDCVLNTVSKLLRRHGVTPYIWMTANLQSLLRRLRKQGKSVGVLGVACIPELIRGIRLCMRVDVPVIGIPLDANRCGRWWGQFHQNSVSVQELERLLV